MKTFITPTFTPSHSYGVVKFGCRADGISDELLTSCCCEHRAHEERRRYLGAEVVSLRPVPAKGAFGGWRIAAEKRPSCGCAGRAY